MPHSLRVHYYHLIWATKNRKNLIVPEIKKRLYGYIGGIVRSHQGHLLSIGGTENHVHLLVSYYANDKISDMVRSIKAKSSRWIHEMFPQHQFAWQEGYGSFSISYSAINRVQIYIINQEHHHKIMTFEEEYLKILIKHNIKLDERYIFG